MARFPQRGITLNNETLFIASLMNSIRIALILAITQLTAKAQLPWPATDHLGRSLPLHEETGPIKQDRYVGIFYFLWLGGHSTSGPHDLTEILKQPSPKFAAPGVFHHWGKPELGYYYSRDPFVLRRHATQLSNAGVDFVALDVTNSFTYDREVDALCKTWLQMRSEGLKTPQIVFLTNSNHTRVVNQLFQRIYKPGKYRKLWFHWQGKPLLMANPEGLSEHQKSFFCLRRSWAWSKGHKWFGDGRDRWPWLDHTPQTPGWHTKGVPEFVPVCIAQHPISNIGRSHQNKTQPAPDQTRSHQGLYFQEQWDSALKIDPEIAFITGWNEWVAQRFLRKAGKAPGKMVGNPLEPGGTYFVDCYNLEFSRDAEPMEGGYGDAYYYQMMANIRRFKGTPPLPAPPTTTTISIDGNFDDWKAIPAGTYSDKLRDTQHRNHESWGKQTIVERSGRNDFANLRVAKQDNSVAFLIHTRAPLTTPDDTRWLNLFIDADQDPTTGWNGYDYLVNRQRKDGKTSLEKLGRSGDTQSISDIPFAFDNNMLELSLPILPEWKGKPLAFDFHASDNAPLNDKFYTKGDHAPDRRFNFRYQTP